nr:hypothetical protein [Streptomyces caniscabiei]
MPPPDHRSEPPLTPEGLVVTVINKAGHPKEFDFSELSVAEPMQRSLAAAFAAQSSQWTSHSTANSYWEVLELFARFISGQDAPSKDLDGLSAALLKRWRAVNIGTNTGKARLTKIRTLLKQDPRIVTGPAAEEVARRVPGLKPGKQSYDDAERERVISTAQRQFRAAWLRITENERLLEQWRTGELEPGSRPWRIGQVLDHLARTGDVPRTQTPSGSFATNRRLLGGTSAARTWARLFLTKGELTALSVLLTDRFAWNLSLYDHMPAPTRTPSAGESGTVTYQVTVEKHRASGGRWYSTENVTDSGADSPGRLITQALQATAPGRVLAAQLSPGHDLLMTARTARPGRSSKNADRPGPVGLLVFGVSKDDAKGWARSHGLAGSPFQRTRRTTVTRERRPLQHTQGTHESVYVLPDKRVQEASREVFEAGAEEALSQARAVTFGGHLTNKADPAHQQTATADCGDDTNSPWPAPDGGCGADFLLCLACTNAHVHPGHHPRLAHLHQQMDSLRSVLPDDTWTTRWNDHRLRLEDLRERVGPAAWKAALDRADEADRALVTLLLKGDLAS